MATDFYNPGNGTGVIITCRPFIGDDKTVTRFWLDRVSFTNLTDGSSNTFLSGEIHIPIGEINVPPYNGAAFNGNELDGHCRIGGPGIPILAPNQEAGLILGFGSAHPGTCNFVHADGSTHAINNGIDTIVLANLCHRSDGEVVGSLK